MTTPRYLHDDYLRHNLMLVKPAANHEHPASAAAPTAMNHSSTTTPAPRTAQNAAPGTAAAAKAADS